MGIFKQFKQMKGVVEQMPAMMDQAQELQRQAQAAQAAQGGYGTAPGAYGMIPQPAAPAANDPRLAAIEGVTLHDYARISKVAAARGFDLAALLDYAAQQGFDRDVYQRATNEWNVRFKGDMGLATYYGRLYQEAQV